MQISISASRNPSNTNRSYEGEQDKEIQDNEVEQELIQHQDEDCIESIKVGLALEEQEPLIQEEDEVQFTADNWQSDASHNPRDDDDDNEI